MNLNKIYFNKIINICLNHNSSRILSQKLSLKRVIMNIEMRNKTTIKKNINQTIDKQKFKTSEESKEIKLINYENRFHKFRKLSAIDRNNFKRFLLKECEDKNESSDVFAIKFDKMKTICEIYNNILEKTFRVPSIITNDLMKQLLDLDFREVYKQFIYLYNNEFQRWYENELRREESIKTRERLEKNYEVMNASRIGIFNNDNQIVYGLWHNTLFTRIRKTHNHRLITRTRLKTASIYGQNIVIDLSYEEYMTDIAVKELLSQLTKLCNFNEYVLNDSFNINFCNLSQSGLIKRLMPKYLSDSKLVFVNQSSDSYLNKFPIEKFVYICPQAEELLLEYDHKAVYILCGVLQRRLDPPLFMSRVREEGVQMKRIPIESYVNLIDGFSLEISDSLKILSHFRDGIDMSEAIERILPQYSKKTDSQVEEEDEERIKKLFYKKKLLEQKQKKKYN